MHTLHDPEFHAVASEFISDVPRRIEAIRAGVQTGELAEARMLAHQLIGSGGGFGFGAISRHAGELLQLLENEEPGARIERAIDDLSAACDAATADYCGA